MQYKPAWYTDQKTFINLLTLQELTNDDLLILARLYIKYQPITNKYELKSCFKYLLKKANCQTIDDLYIMTRKQYG
jgi:hypothetical protein